MKKQLTTLVGSSLVIAGSLSLSTTGAKAANLTSSVLEDFSSWNTSGQACDAVGSGMTAYTDCIGAFSTKSTANDVLGDGRGSLFDALGTGVFGGITNWAFGGKQDAGAKTSGATVDYGFQWTENKEGSGIWSLTKAAENLYADVVISLKTATSWSAYYIQKGTALSDFQNLLWNTSGVELAGNKKNGKALSHASIFFANIETKTPVVTKPVVNPTPVVTEPVVNPTPVATEPVVNEPVVNTAPITFISEPMDGVEVPTNPEPVGPVDIPEPSMMLGLGAIGYLMGFYRRKKNKG
ncbi:PEP-CTERM sorting domain-containing protein [Oscillatoria sp. FACHB-1406]|uniref:PEP-CTERM sorting domain-containing protein n=1 Tax=Oscillatoria sp. FACHB-1406 TaxID=2692846 RepID=UPI0016870426|nr:PEP-CTERM sorting domain-containing protein [Oscillatoria sp. FACHB-1406]MBD2580523.1 PEP-CTERM sorting domain-containing protein [Oscillatoria sp. FACHB-1406]